MKVSQIQIIARKKGIKPGKLKKVDLIHAIQREEGYFECFATAYVGECEQTSCTWRDDCLKTSSKVLAS